MTSTSTDSCDERSGPMTPVRRSRGRVEFEDVVKKHAVIGLSEYSSLEHSACWYSKSEKNQMNEEREKIVARLELDRLCKNNPVNEMSYRYLDCWTIAGSKELTASINQVLTAVLDEQDLQWGLGLDDADRIASKSLEVTGTTQDRALKIAQEDEREVIQERIKEAQRDHCFSQHGGAASPVYANLKNIPSGVSQSRKYKKWSRELRRLLHGNRAN
jgi:hypothetical protein